MPLINRNMGAPIKTTLGRKGEQPTVTKARVAGPITLSIVNGRAVEFVPVITESVNLAGETYLGSRLHNVEFAYDRDESEWSELLDGPKGQPKSITDLIKERQAAALAFSMNLPASANTVNLAEEAE